MKITGIKCSEISPSRATELDEANEVTLLLENKCESRLGQSGPDDHCHPRQTHSVVPRRTSRHSYVCWVCIEKHRRSCYTMSTTGKTLREISHPSILSLVRQDVAFLSVYSKIGWMVAVLFFSASWGCMPCMNAIKV